MSCTPTRDCGTIWNFIMRAIYTDTALKEQPLASPGESMDSSDDFTDWIDLDDINTAKVLPASQLRQIYQ